MMKKYQIVRDRSTMLSRILSEFKKKDPMVVNAYEEEKKRHPLH
jgi:hypothetical protein